MSKSKKTVKDTDPPKQELLPTKKVIKDVESSEYEEPDEESEEGSVEDLIEESDEEQYENGPAFQNGTLIMLYNGILKAVESLVVGDCVAGLDGKAKNITNVYRGNGQLYKILQPNGDEYIVTGDHVLVLKFTNVEGIRWDNSRKGYQVRYIQNLKISNKRFTCIKNKKGVVTDKSKKASYKEAEKFLADKRKEDGYNKKGDIIEISVVDYFALSKDFKRTLYGFKQGFEHMYNPVDLDPYLLGLWLGDGTTYASSITNIDKPIIDYIYWYAGQNNLKVTKVRQRYDIVGVRLGKDNNYFWKLLKQYNLVGNKHIPDDYLRNSREVRLKLLAGLLDTDGSLEKGKNMYEISQLSDKLAVDITKLARSLGFRVGHKKRNKTCVKPDGQRVTKQYNIMLISGRNICDIPCLLERKKAKPCGKDVDFLITMIEVKKCEVGDYTGFKVENSDRFFGKDYTVFSST